MRFVRIGLLALMVAACENEPYEEAPLRITSLKNIDGKVTNTYQYQRQRLFFFKSVNDANATTQASAKFWYKGDLLDRVVADSSQAGYKVYKLFYSGTQVAGDSLFQIAAGQTVAVSRRRFEFNEVGQLAKIEVTPLQPGGVFSEVQLKWEGGNAAEVSFFEGEEPNKNLMSTKRIRYDKQNSLYPRNFAYFYTLPLEDVFWLSVNNPVQIGEEGKEAATLRFWYNKFGYPSNFRDANGKLFGAAYTEIL